MEKTLHSHTNSPKFKFLPQTARYLHECCGGLKAHTHAMPFTIYVYGLMDSNISCDTLGTFNSMLKAPNTHYGERKKKNGKASQDRHGTLASFPKIWDYQVWVPYPESVDM